MKPEWRTYLASKNTHTQNHFTSQTVRIPHRNKPVFMSIYIICGASNRCAWRCVNTPIWPHFPAPTSLLLSNKKRLFLEQPGKTLPGWFCTVCGVRACTRACCRVSPPPTSLSQQSYSCILACPPVRRGVRTLQHHLRRRGDREDRCEFLITHARAHTRTFMNYQHMSSVLISLGENIFSKTNARLRVACARRQSRGTARKHAADMCACKQESSCCWGFFFSLPRLSRRRCSPARSWRFWLKRFDDNRRSGRVSESPLPNTAGIRGMN